MKAIEITAPGEADVLHLVERPDPVPALGEVLIAVEAAGVNRPDILQRQGHYPVPPGITDIPGLEVAGSIVAIGAGVKDWRVGDRCCALLTGGGYATLAVAPAGQCLPIPGDLTSIEAAALPETAFTVWANLFTLGRLSKGESVLIHGGTSGIGTLAIQMARAWGCGVFATAGSQRKVEACQALGAIRGIDYRREDYVAVIAEATDGQGVDVVLDMVGGQNVPRNLLCLKRDGRHVSIAFMTGREVSIDLQLVMSRRLVITGSTMRPRSVAEKSAIAQELRANVWPLIERGEVRPLLERSFGLAEAAAAHRLMESSAHIGKIVLAM